jgi:Carboxypeptidase regulatory-like domain
LHGPALGLWMSHTFRISTQVFAIARVVTSLLLVVTGAFLPSLFAAQDNVVLRGTVVSAIDGTPIRAALVQLLGEKPRAMLTGADGTFEFDGLAAGDAAITVRKPGYFSAQEYYPESVGEQRVHLGPNLQPVALKLYPEAVIYGRLTNENGRPLEGMTVQLTRAGTKGAIGPHESLPSATSNENGEYRLAELRAGTYLVSVSQPQKMDAAFPIAMFQVSKLRSGYPTSFYPGDTDRAHAMPLRLTPGKKVQADLRLTAEPLYRISGSVQGAGGAGAIVVVIVSQNDVNPVAAAAVTPGSNRFVLESVPAGSYFLGAVQEPAQGAGEQKTGISSIEVTQNVDTASIVLSEKKQIEVRFRYERTNSTGNPPGPSGQVASLVRTDVPMPIELFSAALMANPQTPEEGLEITLEPGTYRAVLNGQPDRCVASVKSGTTDILNEELVVTAGASVEPIEVVVRDDCGRVQGTVSKDGQPAMGRVLLIPGDAPRRGVSAAANSDGAFQFQGLVPGRYFAVALDGADDLDPAHPDALAKVKSLATEVDVQASGAGNVKLELKSLEP